MKLPVLSKKIAQGILLLFALAVGTVCIRAQTIQTFAGNGSPALTGYGGPATAAGIGSYPNGVTVDGPGNVYIATSFRILKVNTSGTISLIAGYGSAGFSGDGGPATMARMDGAYDIAVDGAGNVYFSDDGNGRVRKVDIFGIISTFAGISSLGSFSGDGGPATAAGLSALRGLAVDASGNVYLADGGNHRIRKVNTSGIISTFAGNGGSGYSGDGGPATAAAIGNPGNLTFDGAGNLYFTDLLNNLVRKISASGTISAIAGNGTAGYSGDGGPATVAALNGAMGIALDAAGNIYVGDLFNNRVRKINTSGIISTYAGTGIGAYGGDGGPATAAMLRYPCGVATDGSGNIYIADVNNYRIRKITPPTTPTFDGGSPQSLTVCENSVANPINSLLTITDPGSGLTETYSVTMAPTHGAITAGSTVTSGTSLAPTGWAYTPTTGYSGTDAFTIQVSNGSNIAATIVNVTVNPLPVAGTITGTTMLCVGAPGALIDIAPGGVWSTATTGIVALSGSAGTTISVTGLAVGTDTVYYTVTNSCGTAAAYTFVTVNSLPGAGTITGTDTLCEGASVSLADAAPGGVWSSATTGIVALSGSSGPGITATGIMAGTDTVYYTVTNSCGTDTAAFPITVITVPLVPPIIGPSLICGDMIISLTDSLPGGIWSSYDTTIATVDMSGTVSGSMPGLDTIYYTVTNSCGTSFAMHIVTVNTLPVVANITAPIVLCADSAATVSNATPGGSWAATNHHSFLSGGVVTGTTPGFDTITYSVTNLCGTTTVSHVIHMLACDSALAVPFAHQQASISVVPNPSKGMVTLTVNTHSVQQVQVVVTNMLGIKMHECTFVTNTPKEFNVNLPSGMYFISATTASGVKMSAKLVVE